LNQLTIDVSSGVCWANGLLTTVEAADLTYDGFWAGSGLIAIWSSSWKFGGGPGGSGGLIIGGGPGGGPYGGLGIRGTIIPGGGAWPGSPITGKGGLISGGGGGGGGNRDIPGGNTSGCTLGINVGPGPGGCCLGGGGPGTIFWISWFDKEFLLSVETTAPSNWIAPEFCGIWLGGGGGGGSCTYISGWKKKCYFHRSFC